MRLGRLTSIAILTLFLSSFSLISPTIADDAINTFVDGAFNIEFVTATDLNMIISMDVSQITVFGTTYDSNDIQILAASSNVSDIENMGAIKLSLSQLLNNQMEGTFENANINAISSKPTYDSGLFHSEYNVNLTSAFFNMDDAVNAHDFINGVLDIGALVNYSLNLQAEAGWNNTYIVDLGQNIDYQRTTGVVAGGVIQWTVKNGDGTYPERLAEFQLKDADPTTSDLDSEDIFLEFILNSEDADATIFTTNVLVRAADIKIYDVIPSFISNLDYMPADGIRLLISNGFVTWDEFREKTIDPLKNTITSTIEGSSFNQTISIIFSWDNTTAADCVTPYETSNMDDVPSIKALLTDSDVDLQICDISSRALFGLINSGAEANISSGDINFGDTLESIGYDYNITLYLPDNLYLDSENVYTWNESIPLSGKFESDIAPSYSEEDKETTIVIEVESTDLNLLSFFTGKTELTFSLRLEETRNYNISTIRNEFTLPEKVSLDYLNSDAFRLCVEEDVFNEESITEFLNNEMILFENLLKQVLPGLKIKGNVNRDDFEESLIWDRDISNMSAETPVTTASNAHSLYPVYFDLAFLPPSIDIPTKSFNFSGIPNQKVTYKMIFPHGIKINAYDPLNKSEVKETDDGREYIEITFSASESNVTAIVSVKMNPSALFVIGVFMPCIVSFIITLILIIVIYIIRRKRKGRKIEAPPEEEEITGYEEEEYYVPPPPGSK